MPIFLGSDLGSDSIHFTVHRLYVNFVQFFCHSIFTNILDLLSIWTEEIPNIDQKLGKK